MKTQAPRFTIILLHENWNNSKPPIIEDGYIFETTEHQHLKIKNTYNLRKGTYAMRNASIDICWWVDAKTAMYYAEKYNIKMELFNEKL